MKPDIHYSKLARRLCNININRISRFKTSALHLQLIDKTQRFQKIRLGIQEHSSLTSAIFKEIHSVKQLKLD